ncbi:MAG: hypothetical protein ACI9JM_002915 [Halioglobus sp.]|jgi:hypothetical protein
MGCHAMNTVALAQAKSDCAATSAPFSPFVKLTVYTSLFVLCICLAISLGLSFLVTILFEGLSR